MAVHSLYLSRLSTNEMQELREKLWKSQHGKCFISGDDIDLTLHADSLDIDHVIPIANGGKDEESNFALTFASANRAKQAADLNLARIMWQFRTLSETLQKNENRSPNLTDILKHECGVSYKLHFTINGDEISYSLPEIGKNAIVKLPIYTDMLSKEKYFFATLPIQYIYHDDKINPRSICSNVNKLLAEFYKGNPQLHISLGYIESNDSGASEVKLFDGQHKAAAQILLGVKEIPVRIFIDPDKEKITETNFNAGTTLHQIPFGKDVQRHLGSQFYIDRVKSYQKATNRDENRYDFSEKTLIGFFKGETLQMKRYIIDSVKDAITYHEDNKLREYIDMAGKGKEKPLSYSTVEKTFYSFFISSEPLDTPLDFKLEEGKNPRELEKNQIVRLMNIIAEKILINKFDPEIGTYRIENKIQNDENIDWNHVVGYRMMKEEIIYVWLHFILDIISAYFIQTGKMLGVSGKQNFFQEEFPEQLWTNITNYIVNLMELPLWKNKELSSSAFGGKQNYSYWSSIFTKGTTPSGEQIIPQPLDLTKMIIPRI